MSNFDSENTAFSFKYRPTTFSEVLGQENAKNFLSRLARLGKGRHFLISGAFGSGKTSLVQIFAKAINCHCRLNDGSPCGDCPACQSNQSLVTYDTPVAGGERKNVQAWLEAPLIRSDHTKWIIRFFDECHALQPQALDLFLRRLERNYDDGVIYAFATTDPSRLTPAFTSRLVKLHVTELNRADSVRLLKVVCAHEKIQFTTDGLDLIAAAVEGHARSLLGALEDVSGAATKEEDRVDVDAEAVKRELELGSADSLLEYMQAFVDRNVTGRRAALSDWNAPPPEQVRLVIGFLKTMLFSNVLGEDIAYEPLAYALAGGRAVVLTKLIQAMNVGSVREVEPILFMLLSFWIDHHHARMVEPELTLRLFEKFYDGMANTIAPRSLPSIALSERTRPPEVVTEDQFLTYQDALRIVNGASVFVQMQGRYLNTLIEIRSAYRDVDEASAVTAIRDARAELHANLQLVSAISVIERDDGIVARLVTWIASSRLPDLDQAIKTLEKRLKVTIALRLKEEPSPRKSCSRQWRLIGELCASLDPACAKAAELLKILKVSKKKLRQPGPLKCDLVEMLGEINADKIVSPDQQAVQPIEARSTAGLRQITKGWQIEAFEQLSQARRKFEDRLREIEEIHFGQKLAEERLSLTRMVSADNEARQARWERIWEGKPDA